jgi:small neutral amino acid transporter SnatA (MarC family)
MNILIYIIVLLIGASVGYFLGTPGVIGMIAGAIVATLISFDMNRKGRSQISDKIE